MSTREGARPGRSGLLQCSEGSGFSKPGRRFLARKKGTPKGTMLGGVEKGPAQSKNSQPEKWLRGISLEKGARGSVRGERVAESGERRTRRFVPRLREDESSEVASQWQVLYKIKGEYRNKNGKLAIVT